MARKSYIIGIQASIEDSIRSLKVQAGDISDDTLPGIEMGGAFPPGEGPSSFDATEYMLSERLWRVKQLGSWMKEDPDLLKSVDELIGQQVRAAQRRQAVLSVGIAFVSLAGGWLLSAVPVPVLAHVLGR